MGDFSDPKRKLQEELDDLHQDIDVREKRQRELGEEMARVSREKELLEDELEELYKKEEELKREVERAKME